MIDSKIKLYIDDKYYSSYSISGFNIRIPFSNDKLKLQINSLFGDSTMFYIEGLKVGYNYNLFLSQDQLFGGISKKYVIEGPINYIDKINIETKRILSYLVKSILGGFILFAIVLILAISGVFDSNSNGQTTNSSSSTNVDSSVKEDYQNGYENGQRGRDMGISNPYDYCRVLSARFTTLPPVPSKHFIEGYEDGYNGSPSRY